MTRRTQELRLTHLKEFLDKVSSYGGKFPARKKRELGKHFLEVVIGLEDEFIACKPGNESPDFEPHNEELYPWALFVTAKDDLQEDCNDRAILYLHSDNVNEKMQAVITNGKELRVFDSAAQEKKGHTVLFAELLDGKAKAQKNWQAFLSDFGVESAKEKKRKQHAQIVAIEKQRVGTGQIYQGDNLEVMRSLEGGKIDLIYIDPPFCAQNVMQSKAWGKKVVSFNDEWGGGINSYIRWLVPRLRECHRLLKDTGSFFLHLDYRSSHYAKVELDKIFGASNFRNEIVWCYAGGGISKKYLPRKHDTILWYSKSENYFYDAPMRKYSQTGSGRHSDGSTYDKDRDRTPCNDWWNDISPVNSMSNERLGYPTQKPIPLLKRAIKMSCPSNGVVADFFCGCGTTVSAAQNLKRKWLGCDVSKDAIAVIRKRMIKEHKLKVDVIKIGNLSKKEIYKLSPFEFEKKMVELIGGTPNIKQVGDRGVDGRMHDSTPIQVKKTDNIGRPVIDSFYRHVKSGNGKGIIIAKSFAKTAYEEIDRLFNEEGLQIDLVPSDDIIRDAA